MYDPRPYLMLADAVLILHAAIALFVAGGLAVIIAGNLRGWRGVNGLGFRLAHLAAIAVISAQAWLGAICPLTSIEMWLRERAGAATYSGSFMGHWLQRILYYDAPDWAFTLAYSLFGLAVVATWRVFPPKWGRHQKRTGMKDDKTRTPTDELSSPLPSSPQRRRTMTQNVVITVACGTDNPNRATRAIHLATVAHREGKNVTLFLLDEAIYLAKKGLLDNLRAATGDVADDLMTYLQANNVPVLACTPCAKARGVTESDLIEGARMGTAIELIHLACDATVISL